ncbi:MAG: efflux RND transporter periplasmic adaptor subunit, partial [Luteolibacter sp.]
IRLISYQQPAAIAVPNKALGFDDSGWTVEVKLADGKTERRSVKRGRASKDETEILSGLEVGQVVVVP